MELKTPYFPALVCSSRNGLPGLGKYPEPPRELLDAVAVAQPALKAVGQVREKRIRFEDID